MSSQTIADGGYIECAYNVTNTNEPTQLIGVNLKSYQMSTIYSMVVDDVTIAPVREYKFVTEGEHIVRINVAPIFDAYCLFDGCEDLVSVTFHLSNEMKVRLYRVFNDCNNLVRVDWGNSNMYIESLYYMFRFCNSLGNIDLRDAKFGDGTVSSDYAFRECDNADSIVLGNINKLDMRYTFWSMKNSSSIIDLTQVKSVVSFQRPFVNSYQPTLIDFGTCDLSACKVTEDPFFDCYKTNSNGKVVMLGKPVSYPNVVSKQLGLSGEFVYNLNYDYSKFIETYPNIIPIANESVNKILRIRFCTNNEWVIDPASNFVINGVTGVYTSQGVWEFPMVADTYKYPILHDGEEIGEAIVKDDVQQIAFGNNDTVYQVIDFSAEDSFNIDVITSNDGWVWNRSSPSSAYYGMASNDIENGQTTSIIINTGMIGEVILTMAQSSQTYYHYGRLYGSDDKLIMDMEGSMYQSSEIQLKVSTNDGVIRFTYDKTGGSNTHGLDKVFIKKIEKYNWVELLE